MDGMTLNIFKEIMLRFHVEKNLQLNSKGKQTFTKPFTVQIFICASQLCVAPATIASLWKKLLEVTTSPGSFFWEKKHAFPIPA